MTVYNKQVGCVACGKAAPKATEAYFKHNKPYQGNLKVIRDSSVHYPDGRVHYDLVLWDGESYKLKYHKFCSQTCAVQYANLVAPLPHCVAEEQEQD